MITAVRLCGIVSVPGVYGGPVPVNMGSVVQKGLTIKSGQTYVKRYLEPLTKLIQDGTIDPTFLITHRSTDLAEGPDQSDRGWLHRCALTGVTHEFSGMGGGVRRAKQAEDFAIMLKASYAALSPTPVSRRPGQRCGT